MSSEEEPEGFKKPVRYLKIGKTSNKSKLNYSGDEEGDTSLNKSGTKVRMLKDIKGANQEKSILASERKKAMLRSKSLHSHPR